MKQLFKRIFNRETIFYLIFGVLTTLVDWAVFKIGKILFGAEWVLVINAVAFVAAAVFAYITNKLFVFESRSWSPETLKKEIPMFFAARLFSFAFTEAGLWIAKAVLNGEERAVIRFDVIGYSVSLDGLDIAKIILSVIVVLLNYLFSKLLIFRKK